MGTLQHMIIEQRDEKKKKIKKDKETKRPLHSSLSKTCHLGTSTSATLRKEILAPSAKLTNIRI